MKQDRLTRMNKAGGVLALACVSALGLWCFGDVLFRDRQLAFRDAGQYYYPLYLRVQQEWDAGRWPLWAPEANAGTPLLGDPTAAVLYPGKLAYAWLPYAWAARAYAIAHVVLAFASAYAMLRAWRISTTGSLVGAMAYAFGAPILSLTCNVVFLVGASWIPLGFLAIDQWLRLGRRWGIPALAVVLAMQVLGGDPEAAYLLGLFGSAYAVGLSAAGRRDSMVRLVRWGLVVLVAGYLGLLALAIWTARARYAAAMAPEATWRPTSNALVAILWAIAAAVVIRRDWKRRDTSGLSARMGGLVAAAFLATGITSAQLLPILEYSRQSFRANEIEGFHDVYPFSVQPFQLLDAIWPNLFGTTDRGNRAWIGALPPLQDDRNWVPSLYRGGLALILAVSSMRLRGGPAWRVALSWLAIVSLLAALGLYASPVFWGRCVPGWGSLFGPLDPGFAAKGRPDGLIRMAIAVSTGSSRRPCPGFACSGFRASSSFLRRWPFPDSPPPAGTILSRRAPVAPGSSPPSCCRWASWHWQAHGLEATDCAGLSRAFRGARTR